MKRGEIWWANLPEPDGSGPGHRRPVVVVQADSFNESRIQTVVVAVVTSNMRLADAPGNVALTRRQSRLPKDAVINVSQLITLDRAFLTARVAKLGPTQMSALDDGLRLVLAL